MQWINHQEKAPFVLILTKPVEPIFQSAGPILGHTPVTALEGTLGSSGYFITRVTLVC